MPSFVLLDCNSTYNFYKPHEQWKQSLMDLPLQLESECRLWTNVLDLLFKKKKKSKIKRLVGKYESKPLAPLACRLQWYAVEFLQSLGSWMPRSARLIPTLHAAALCQLCYTFQKISLASIAQRRVELLVFSKFSYILDVLLWICQCWHFCLGVWQMYGGLWLRALRCTLRRIKKIKSHKLINEKNRKKKKIKILSKVLIVLN